VNSTLSHALQGHVEKVEALKKFLAKMEDVAEDDKRLVANVWKPPPSVVLLLISINLRII
jgi:hypothetical protein